MKVVIVDYGMGNLGSVRRAFEEAGAGDVEVSDNPSSLSHADRCVLPGVGAFAEGMHNLVSRKWVPAIQEALQKERVPLLGICLGMQLLADRGFEGGDVQGLGLIPGEVKRLQPQSNNTRIPHVGWNEVQRVKSRPIFEGIADGTDFYFVHSYHFIAASEETVVGVTPYCGRFVSIVAKDNVYGVQFHPEKSQKPGLQLLRNFLKE